SSCGPALRNALLHLYQFPAHLPSLSLLPHPDNKSCLSSICLLNCFQTVLFVVYRYASSGNINNKSSYKQDLLCRDLNVQYYCITDKRERPRRTRSSLWLCPLWLRFQKNWNWS